MPWGLLVRISEDRDREALGVDRQERIGRAFLDARGVADIELYRENDTSAFKRKTTTTLPDGRRVLRVPRPELDRALADLYHGRIDGLVVYDLDRLTRDPRDLEDLIDVVEETRRPAVSVTGNLDLSTDHGIDMARFGVTMANRSSRDTRRRVKLVHDELAAAGKPTGGRRPYGYEKDRLTVIPAEAAVVREIARRRLQGETWLGIAIDLNKRKVPTVTGTDWNTVSVQRVVQKPHVAGLRYHRGEFAAAGTWPAILTEHEWRAMQGSPRQVGAQPHRRYLLSSLARCGRCAGRMGAGRNPKRGGGTTRRYRCQAIATCRGVSRNADHLDEYVTGIVLGLLADLQQPTPQPDERASVDLMAFRARLRQLEDALVKPDAEPVPLILRSIDRLREQVVALEARAAEAVHSQVLGDARGLSREQWDALPLDRRRAIIAELVTVTVFPGKRGRGFDAASVRVEPAW